MQVLRNVHLTRQYGHKTIKVLGTHFVRFVLVFFVFVLFCFIFLFLFFFIYLFFFVEETGGPGENQRPVASH
jgi:hypothetical protein